MSDVKLLCFPSIPGVQGRKFMENVGEGCFLKIITAWVKK